MVFNSLKRKVKDINRFRQIIDILFQGELRVLVKDLNLHKHVSPSTRIKMTTSKPKIVVETLERLGPTFVKLGQLLSVRPDLLPPEYIEELKKLQDNVPAFPFQAVKDVIQNELKKPLSKIFSEFSEKPLAAASTSQVHLATLRESKKKVAVKVQRPGIAQTIKKDIEILEYLAKKFDKSKKYPFIDAVEIIEEFKEYTSKELDLRVEASRMKTFYKFHQEKKDIKIIIPEVYEDYCSSKVLIMKAIKGTPLTDMASLKKRKVDLKSLTITGIEAVMDQVFELGMFHADAHPGNLMLVRTKTKKNKIVDKLAFLDYGIVGNIDNELKRNSLKMFDGLVNEDVDKTLKALISVGTKRNNFNKELLRKIVKNSISGISNKTLEEVRISSIFHHLLEKSIKAGLKIDQNLLLLGKAYVVLESTANYLYPKTNLSQILLNYFDKHRGLFVKEIMNESKKTVSNFADFAKKVPIYSEHLDEMINKGVKINVDKKEFKYIIQEYDLEMNKRILGTITAALILGSSLLSLMNNESLVFGLKLYEAGFLFAGVCLIMLFLYVLKTHNYLNE